MRWVRIALVAFYLCLAQFALWSFKFATLQESLKRKSKKIRRHVPDRKTLEGWANLVERVDARGPWKPSCLRQSLALGWLFKTRGVEPIIQIGVLRKEEKIKAHAWVELVDSSEPGFLIEPSYQPLTAAKSKE